MRTLPPIWHSGRAACACAAALCLFFLLPAHADDDFLKSLQTKKSAIEKPDPQPKVSPAAATENAKTDSSRLKPAIRLENIKIDDSRPAPVAPTADPTPAPTKKAAKSKQEPKNDPARPWRHLPLDVAAAKYGGHIDRTRVFPGCKPMGLTPPRRGELLVGSLTVVKIVPSVSPSYCVLTYRHSSGQLFVMQLPAINRNEVCVGGVDVARVWCPARVLVGGNPAEISMAAGYMDSTGLK